MQDAEDPRSVDADLAALAERHGFAVDAVRHLHQAIARGHGTMAQFDHPALGGHGQWMRGGMTQVGRMFDDALRTRVAALAADLAGLPQASAEMSRTATMKALPGMESMKPMKPMEPMEPMEPMKPMEPIAGPADTPGWPAHLRNPASSGSQNGRRYAWYAAERRLVVDEGEGRGVRIYDTGEHRIGGVSQQQPAGHGLRFTSQLGEVDVAGLPRVER